MKFNDKIICICVFRWNERRMRYATKAFNGNFLIARTPGLYHRNQNVNVKQYVGKLKIPDFRTWAVQEFQVAKINIDYLKKKNGSSQLPNSMANIRRSFGTLCHLCNVLVENARFGPRYQETTKLFAHFQWAVTCSNCLHRPFFVCQNSSLVSMFVLAY